MTKYRIIDLDTTLLHKGSYNAVHTTFNGRKDGVQIRWVTHLCDETTIAVENADAIAVDCHDLWIGKAPYYTEEAKVVWTREAGPCPSVKSAESP